MRDRFNRKIDYLRISLTDNCNLRCIYCMEEDSNNFYKKEDKLTTEEICKVVTESAKLGIKKIRFTGGEPLVYPDILNLVKRVNKIEGIEGIYLTTNGILLERYLKDFYENGVKGVNISLDSLKKDKFKEITRGGDINKVLSSIEKALEFGIKVKVNTVLIKEINEEEILDFVNFTKYNDVDVRFIELMPIGIGSTYKGVTRNEIENKINENYEKTKVLANKSYEGPAKYIRVENNKGRVGFISPISNCFCDECNRIRLTSQGFLKECLHFNYGIDLKKLMRNGATENEINLAIRKAIFEKPEKHVFLEKNKDKDLKFMNQIGG
ncbi:GTP 3',8-cyclase MoaA [Clostridium sp.]|uniref:GTP 3',8-cyclase MoaA n=1 Tax=Clostridium sp. TaxID=1506 RepID=UPI00260C1640|nr:GTP 3',8-cyclase MoaA [Clostridium sp.]